MNNHEGATSNWYRDDYYDNGTIDYLCVGDGTNYTHLNDFNSNDAGTNWKTVYMENSSALSFKYHCSWSNEEFTYFKCAEIDVPGVGKGWYVGMCMYGEKDDNGDRKINKEQKDYEYADDWIVKVIPGNGSTISVGKTTKVYKKKTVMVHKWVFCEDLGSSSSNKDYDYNDLVFDAKIIDEYKVQRDADGNETPYTDDSSHSYYAEVTPLAAGGELTIKFDKISTSIHGLFGSGVSDNILINTCGENQTISASHQERLLASTQKYAFSSASDANIDNITVFVRSQTAVYDLSAYMGEAPHKICVPAGTRWAYERTDIKEAYTGFKDYVGGGAEPWSTTGVEENLYPLEGAAYEMKTDMTGTVSYEEVSSSSSTEYSYTLADATNEHVWWSDISGNTTFKNWSGYVSVSANDLNAAEIGNGTIIRFYFTCSNSYMIKVTDSTWGDFDLGNTGWNQNIIQGDGKSGYVEFKLNTTTANRFKQSGLIIQGTGDVIALALTYDNSKKSTDNGNSGSGSAFWSSTNYGYQQLISTTDLNNAGIDSSKSMTVKITGTPLSWGWGEIYIMKDWTRMITAGSGVTSQYAHFDENPGYVAIPVSASQVQEILATSGLRIEINNFNTTKLELIQ